MSFPAIRMFRQWQEQDFMELPRVCSCFMGTCTGLDSIISVAFVLCDIYLLINP